VEPVEYHLVHRLGKWGSNGWWRPVVGILVLAVLVLLVVQLVLLVAFTVGFVVTGSDVQESIERLLDTDNVTPAGLAYLNLALAGAIPATMLVTWAFHGLRPGWLSSVLPRLRWRWLMVCLGLAFVALVVTLLVSALLPSQGESTEMSDELNKWTSTTRDFVLVVLFLTPLQAAGEEYAFRGYLTQAFGGLFAPLSPMVSRAAAVLLPAVLFALAHGAQELPIFIDRLAFGIVAGILVIATGGLEAGIAMHVLNNFVAFGFALAFGDMSSALNPSGSTWWTLPVTLTQALSYTALAILVGRAMKVRTRTDPVELVALNRRV
jgi:uncharacterized protein